MALSIDHLSEYLRQQDIRPSMELTWCQSEQTSHQSLPWKGDEFPWNGLSCLSVVCYVLKFCSDSEHHDVTDTIRRLNYLASEYNSGAPILIELQSSSGDDNFVSASSMMKRDSDNERCLQYAVKRREIAETFVNTFFPKTQQFFSFEPKRNEHLASFIHFLLQILNSESNYCDQYEGLMIFRHVLTVQKRNRQLTPFLQNMLYFASHNFLYESLGSDIPQSIQTGMSDILQSIQTGLHIWLQRSLNFIFTVLGDVPFQFNYANSLISEFEVFANEAGSLIYAYIFSTCPVNASQFSEQVVVLSQKFELLNLHIQEHCVEFSKLSIPMCADPMNTKALDSQFIVDSLLEDLQNFVTSRNDLTSAMKQKTAALREELILAQSFIEDTNVPVVTKYQELKIQIRDTAYEAEYLLNSFVVGDFPVSYFSLRLPMIIEKLKLIRKGCKEIKLISGSKASKVKDNRTEFPTQKMVLAPDNIIVGFENKTTMHIMDELTGGSQSLVYICVHGMPGLGKSTLAKRLYNHRLITNRFDECAWCWFSNVSKQKCAD